MKNVMLGLGCLGLLASSVFAADAKKGQEVFEANCAVCHNATSTETKMGPGLKGLFKKAELGNKEKISDATVTNFIKEGGNGMPPFADALTKAEFDDLLAYLKTL